MQHHVSGRLDSHLVHGGGVLHTALLVMAAGFAALVASWLIYMVGVAAFLLWG
jgi:hypothetical protein